MECSFPLRENSPFPGLFGAVARVWKAEQNIRLFICECLGTCLVQGAQKVSVYFERQNLPATPGSLSAFVVLRRSGLEAGRRGGYTQEHARRSSAAPLDGWFKAGFRTSVTNDLRSDPQIAGVLVFVQGGGLLIY